MSSITKGQIGAQDLHLSDGSATKTFTRLTSNGYLLTLNDATFEVDALVTFGGGSRFTKATIDAALAVIGTTNKVTLLLRPGTWTITGDLTIPANVTLKTPPGALITIATGVTLTLNGSFEADPKYQVFSCTGTGAVVFGTGSVKEVYPEWWQENTAPGTTDMTSGITAAVKTWVPVKLQSGQTYYSANYAVIYIPANKTVTMGTTGDGRATMLGGGFSLYGTKKGSTTLTNNATPAKEGLIQYQIVTVTSATNVAAGDLLVLTTNLPWDYDNAGGTIMHGEVNVVRSIANTTEATLESPCAENYTPSATLTTTVDSYGKSEVQISNITFENASEGSQSYNLIIKYCQNVVIKNVGTKNSQAGAISVSWSYNVLVDGCHIKNEYTEDGPVKIGYGVMLYSDTNFRVVNNHIENSGRGVHIDGSDVPSRHGVVANNVVNGYYTVGSGTVQTCGLGGHGGAEDVLFAGNVISGNYNGIRIRFPNASIIGNIFTGSGNSAISMTDGDNLTVQGNTVDPYFAGRTLAYDDRLWNTFLGIHIDNDAPVSVKVKNNTANYVRENFINLLSPMRDLTVTGNDWSTFRKSGTASYFVDGATATLRNALIRDNHIISLQHLQFNTGTHSPVSGEVITGGGSGATAIAQIWKTSSGSWAGGDMAGDLFVSDITGSFAGAETIQDPGTNAIAKLLATPKLGAAVAYYNPALSLDWYNCQVDNWTIPITSSNLLVWNGSGTLANISGSLSVSINKGIATIAGYAKFDVVANNAKLRISGIRRALTVPFYAAAYSVATARLLSIMEDEDYLYLSLDAAAYDTTFTPATNYTIPINISYNLDAEKQ